MKKAGFLFFAVIFFSSSRIAAQGFHLGIKAGTNIAQINGRSFDGGFKWGFSAGAFAEINITSKWGIQPELLFNQTNTQTASNFNQIYPQAQAINYQNVRLNYMSIPVLLSLKPIPVLSFQAGPQFGVLLNSSNTILGNGANAFKSGDFSLVFGAQLNLLKIKIGARYISGLTNLDNVGDKDTWRNQSFQFYVGLRIL